MSTNENSNTNASPATTPTSLGAVAASTIGMGVAGIPASTGDASVYSPAACSDRDLQVDHGRDNAELSSWAMNFFHSNKICFPNIPYVGIIPQGLVPGKSILVKGLVVSGRDKRFTINLSCGLLVEGDRPDDIALHVDFRFDESTLILNTLTGGVWGAERRFANPARRGQAVEVRILAEVDSFNVAVNGQNICEFGYRLALHAVKTLYIKGCVQVDVIQYEQAAAAADQLKERGNDGEAILVTSPLYQPPVPFTCSVPGKFIPGRSRILITGTARLHARVFVIDVKCGNDTALHISVRFREHNEVRLGCCRCLAAISELFRKREEKTVVLNTRRNGKWENEKRLQSDFPFLQGGTFDLVIMTDYNGFNLRVNGRHYTDFPHRFKPDLIDGLDIEGDLQLQQIWFKM